MYYLFLFSLEKKPKRKPTLNAMLSKVQFTFKVNSIDSLQGIEIEILSIHYIYTYRFIQIHIHTQTYCIIGRFVYSFWKQFGFTVNHPVWLHDYIVTVGQPWISISMPWSESIEFTLNVNCTFDNIAFLCPFILLLNGWTLSPTYCDPQTWQSMRLNLHVLFVAVFFGKKNPKENQH
jgi:hypothetical protein